MRKYLRLYISLLVGFLVFLQSDVLFANIAVSGEGTVHFNPNMVEMHVGVATFNESLADAFAQNTETVANIIEGLQELGVPEGAVQTLWLNVWRSFGSPFMSWSIGEDVVEGFNVDNTFVITLHELELLNYVLDVVIGLGATSISGINFDNSNRDEYYLQALALAIENGMVRGHAIAEALGRSLGEVYAVHEAPIDPWEIRGGFGGGISISNLYSLGAEGASGFFLLPPEQVSVTARLHIVFE